MKSFLYAVISGLFASAALAQDITASSVNEPIILPQSSGADWTGGYGGIQLGAGYAKARLWGYSASEDITTVGIYAGYLHDFGDYVVGGEGDYNSLSGDGDGSLNLFRLRVRTGVKLGQILPYLTTGIAFLSEDDVSETAFTFGIGAEYRINDHFLLGLEYNAQTFTEVDNTPVDIEVGTLQLRTSFLF